MPTNRRAEQRIALNCEIKYSIRNTHLLSALLPSAHTVLHTVTLMAHTIFVLLSPSPSPSLHLSVSVLSSISRSFTLALSDAAPHPLFGLYLLPPSLSPHDVVVSINGRPISGPAEVSRVPHHGAAQAASRIPRAVWRPPGNHLR